MALSLSGAKVSSSIFESKRDRDKSCRVLQPTLPPSPMPTSATVQQCLFLHLPQQQLDASSVSSLSLYSCTSTNASAFVSLGATTPNNASCDKLDEPDVIVDKKLSVPIVPPNLAQVFLTHHLEFSHCADERYRLTSQHTPGTPFKSHFDDDPPYYVLLSTYLSYVILIIIGHVCDFFGKCLYPLYYMHLMPHKVCISSHDNIVYRKGKCC